MPYRRSRRRAWPQENGMTGKSLQPAFTSVRIRQVHKQIVNVPTSAKPLKGVTILLGIVALVLLTGFGARTGLRVPEGPAVTFRRAIGLTGWQIFKCPRRE